MNVSVKWQKREKLAQKLNALSPELLRQLEIVNREAAVEMVNSAKSFAPVRSGALRESIRYEMVGGATAAVRILAGGSSTTRPATTRGGTYDYALGVEFGTSDTNAQPFFFPSYRLAKKRHKGKASRAITKAAKAVAGQ